MFCKRCGKQVPNDSTYCPYCGETLKAWTPHIPQEQKIQETNIVSSVDKTDKKDPNKIYLGKLVLTKQEVIRLKPFNKLSRATMILSFVAMPVCFMILMGVAFALNGDEKTSSQIITIGKIGLIIGVIYLITLLAINIWHLVEMYRHKKIVGQTAKGIFLFRYFYLIFIAAIVAITIYNLSLNATKLPTGLFVANIVPTMFSFMFSIINGILIKTSTISPSVIQAVEIEMGKAKK